MTDIEPSGGETSVVMTSQTTLTGIVQHPARHQLTDELHARPFEELVAPGEVFLFAKLTGEGGDHEERQHLRQFCTHFSVAPPDADVKHFSAEFGAFRFRWERHAEFTTYAAITKHREPPAELMDWLKQTAGELLVATHLSMQDRSNPDAALAVAAFAKNSLVTAAIASREAQAWTDLRIHADGYNHILLINQSLTPLKMGRVVQRLLEISTYRNMALLALPIAQQMAPRLAEIDRALSQLLIRMRAETGANDLGQDSIDEDTALLKELSRLSAEIQELSSSAAYRFSASKAYYALVNSRVAELDEKRVAGFQSIGEFLDRRLSPAMRTCESVSDRLENLATRAARAANLLRTRVDLVLERQNHELLESMNRRARLQLRLQETVEGLSIAAITYYLVGLVGYAAKTLKEIGVGVNPELVAGAVIIPIALLVGLGVKHIRRSVNADDTA